MGTFIHTNTIESAFPLLKRDIIGSWHKISANISNHIFRKWNSGLIGATLKRFSLKPFQHMVTDHLTFERLTA
jgi:hypothetical protein